MIKSLYIANWEIKAYGHNKPWHHISINFDVNRRGPVTNKVMRSILKALDSLLIEKEEKK